MDGVSHINIYSKGATELGRNLSNFSRSPIETVDGHFESIEGYWYWLNAGPFENREPLRQLCGYDAKKYGRECKANDWNDQPKFKLKIYHAMLTKLLTNYFTYEKFMENKLPFRHYYSYAGKHVEPKDGQWIIDMWTFLQQQLSK